MPSTRGFYLDYLEKVWVAGELMAMNVSLRGALRAAVFWLCPNLDGADPIESMMLLREQIVAQQVISTAVTNWCVFNGGLGLSSDE